MIHGGRDRSPLWIAVASICMASWILFADSAPPALGDFAEWTFHGVLLRDLLTQGHVHGYLLKHYPVPNSATTVGLGLLMLALSWQTAAKLWLVLELITVVAAAWWLNRVAAGARWALVLVIAGGALGIAFWAGFSNFLLGCACVMVLAAQLLRGRIGVLPGAALLLLTFFCHMIPFAFAVLLLVFFAVQHRRFALLPAALPALVMTFWYLAARALNGDADGKAGMISSVSYGSVTFLLFKINTFLKCGGLINPALAEHDSLLLKKAGAGMQISLVVLDLAVAGIAGVLIAARGIRSIRTSAGDCFFWWAAAVLLGAGLLLPGALGGVSDPGGRLVQMVVWCAVLFVGSGVRERRWALVGGVCALPLLLSNLLLLRSVAMRAPEQGETGGPLPAALRQFGHVYYADRYEYYDSIRRGEMDRPIYPTALFLKAR